MDDPEFRKLFTKYVDNPNDKNRTKKIQAYADGMLSDAPISGFESVTVKEERLKKVCSLVLGEDFDQDFIYEDVDFTKPSAIKDGYKSFALKEKVNENRAIVHNPKGIKRFIKQAEKKFPQYKGEIEQLEDDEIIFPNDPKLIKFFKGAKEVKFVLKDSVDLEEATADWIIYDKKTGKRLSPSKAWRKWQGAKMAASKIGGAAEVADKAWYHDNKAKLMGEATDLEEASDKELDIKSLKDLIKNPSPKMIKQYGGKDKYIKMLKSKLAKLEATELDEAIKSWEVIVIKPVNKLKKNQKVVVKAANTVTAIKKAAKLFKIDDKLITGKVDVKLKESIEESNKDKYMWGDINNAMSGSGLNPRVIMNVLSKLKGKAVK
jgi:hypothetical protein